MRPWLVSIGVAFLVVGGAALASLYAASDAPNHEQVDSTSTVEVNPTIWALTAPLWGENGSAPSFYVHWQSTVPVQVTLLDGAGSRCPGGGSSCGSQAIVCPCPVTNWTDRLSGNWSSSQALDYPYYVRALAVGADPGIMTVYATGTAVIDQPSYTLQRITGTFAGSAAVLVGAVALFLGLFLRASPYAAPPPVIPLSPEDLDELYGPGSEEDEPPPARPPGRR